MGRSRSHAGRSHRARPSRAPPDRRGGPTRRPSVLVALPDEPNPFEGQERVDRLQRPRVRDDQVGQAARRDRLRLGAELLADALDDPVHLSGEPVDEPGLQARGGVLRDHRLRLDEVDLEQPSRAREERLHRDLDPRRQYAADVLPFRRDHVEVRRGAEVDHDRRRPVTFDRRDRVRDPVRPDLARVVVADRHAGLDARPELEQLDLRVLLREVLVRAVQLRHGRGQRDPLDRGQLEKAPVERAELVAAAVALGRHAPVLA